MPPVSPSPLGEVAVGVDDDLDGFAGRVGDGDGEGNARGTAPASGTFPDDDRGFLNDPGDPVTGLADVGARWYDPVTGCFASVDPVPEASAPAEINGYSHAGGDPVNGA